MPNFFPQVGTAAACRMGWIAFSLLVSFVEGEKFGIVALQLGGYEDKIGVKGEVAQASTEF